MGLSGRSPRPLLLAPLEEDLGTCPLGAGKEVVSVEGGGALGRRLLLRKRGPWPERGLAGQRHPGEQVWSSGRVCPSTAPAHPLQLRAWHAPLPPPGNCRQCHQNRCGLPSRAGSGACYLGCSRPSRAPEAGPGMGLSVLAHALVPLTGFWEHHHRPCKGGLMRMFPKCLS